MLASPRRQLDVAGIGRDLVAAVFAAAVAQARSVAPGVRAAQQLLVASVRSTQAAATTLAQRRSTLSAKVDDVRRIVLADDAEDSGCWPVSTCLAWPRPAHRLSGLV